MNFLEKSDNKIAVQDNRIIESCYSMTLAEKRLLLLGMSKVNPRIFEGEERQKSFQVSREEYAEVYPDSGNAERSLKRAAMRLLKRDVRLHPREGRTKVLNWFESVEYDTEKTGTGMVEIVFTDSMITLLTPLLRQFTQINLLSVNKLNSIYSIRLYELLIQFRSTGVRRISIEDFRIALDVQAKYTTTKLLIQKVVRPAMQEVNRASDIKVNYKPLKIGKTIKEFLFVIEENAQLDLLK